MWVNCERDTTHQELLHSVEAFGVLALLAQEGPIAWRGEVNEIRTTDIVERWVNEQVSIDTVGLIVVGLELTVECEHEIALVTEWTEDQLTNEFQELIETHPRYRVASVPVRVELELEFCDSETHARFLHTLVHRVQLATTNAPSGLLQLQEVCLSTLPGVELNVAGFT